MNKDFPLNRFNFTNLIEHIRTEILIPNVITDDETGIEFVFVKRKCEQKGPKKVSTFSTRFHVVSNVFPKYQMLTF